MRIEFQLADALKAQQWERAKGELRALVAMQGSYSTSGGPPDKSEAAETRRWHDIDKRVEDFIASVENDGLHE